MTTRRFSLTWPDGRVESLELDLETKSGQKAGGAGRVLRHPNNRDFILKLYHEKASGSDERLRFYQPKVEAMIAAKEQPRSADEHIATISWPLAVLAEGGEFRGFAMPMGRGEALSDALHKTYLEWPLRRRFVAAHRLAGLIAAVHMQNCHVVDLKAQNAMVDLAGDDFVTLIDCDGLALWNGRFPPPQSTDGYRLPEASHNSWPSTTREWSPEQCEAQDRFALAVVLFEILHAGTHPFTGPMIDPNYDRAPSALQDKINAGVYAYVLNPDNYWASANPLWASRMLDGQRLRCKPHEDSVFSRLPGALQDLFDRAFNNLRSGGRPSAIEWKAALEVYAREGSAGAWCEEHDLPYADGSSCAVCQAEAAAREAERQRLEAEARRIDQERSAKRRAELLRWIRRLLGGSLAAGAAGGLLYVAFPNLLFALMLGVSATGFAERLAASHEAFDPNKLMIFSNRSSFARAVSSGRASLITVVLERGGLLNAYLVKQVFADGSPETWEILRESLINWNEQGRNALNIAAELGRIDAIEWLDANGRRIKGPTHDVSPLQSAVQGGSVDAFERLIALGASLEANAGGEPLGIWLLRSPERRPFLDIYLSRRGKMAFVNAKGKRQTMFSVAVEVGVEMGRWDPLQRLMKETKLTLSSEDEKASSRVRPLCRRNTDPHRRPPADVCKRFGR